MAYALFWTPEAAAALEDLSVTRAGALRTHLGHFAQLIARRPPFHETWLRLATVAPPVMRLVLEDVRVLFEVDQERQRMTVLALLPLPTFEEQPCLMAS